MKAARAPCWTSSTTSPSVSRPIDEYETLLTDNRIWKQRTVDIGVVSPELAHQWGMTGPMLRGSGIAWDLRKKQPYAKYDAVDFDIPLGKRRLLRPLPGPRCRNARVQPHHQAMRGVAEGQPGPVITENFKVAPPSREGHEVDMEALIHHFKLFTEGMRAGRRSLRGRGTSEG
jgi:NADH-quinone oxidoreductase subunit D